LAALAAVVLALSLLGAGCGGDGERTNSLRPPSAVNVAVQIGDERVSVSPRRIGAGPLNIIVSNQSSASHQVLIDGPRVKRSVGPINPEDTASLQVTVSPGEYIVSVEDSGTLTPGRLQVGAKRPSAQNELLLP
jgi:hypothetical protein